MQVDPESTQKPIKKGSGILLHPTSLPGPFAIGDLGPEAYAFADFLSAAGQSLWQVLPLNPIDYGGSPYSSSSAFAGNTLLISPELLVTDGLLQPADLKIEDELSRDVVHFAKARELKQGLLAKAFENFTLSQPIALCQSFDKFCSTSLSWLDDYALFEALKAQRQGRPWNEWKSGEARREPDTIAKLREELSQSIEAQKFYQFLFFRQWQDLKNYCNERGIQIIGDMPIFVAYDSADTWAAPEQFKLDHDNRPTVVAGVPPDYFSDTGQLWGNPLYNWDEMRAQGFGWWVRRVRAVLQMFDSVRIDHFRGFRACWEIPAGETTAERGDWVEAPGSELFTTLKSELGHLPIIAEDLGVITLEVDELRDGFGFPGMRVLQFGFSGGRENIHLPHNFPTNVIAYTGTHDNDTTVGWFKKLCTADGQAQKKFCLEYLKSDGEEINWDFIRAVLESEAHTAIIPLQDVLGLGSEARMNLPSTTEGNWSWRFSSVALDSALENRLRSVTESTGRLA